MSTTVFRVTGAYPAAPTLTRAVRSTTACGHIRLSHERPTTRRICHQTTVYRRSFSHTSPKQDDRAAHLNDHDLTKLGRTLSNEFAHLREKYETPRYPIVLAHGLLGFAELKLAANYLPPIHYWRGIKEALSAQGCEVITATVPASGTIEHRAAKLGEDIARQCGGKAVNIVAHSMGGLDARYMISQLQPADVDVKSLVTVATPHHGSAVADWLMDEIGPDRLPKLYRAWERVTGLESGAFAQLRTGYMNDEFNPRTPDDPTVRYFSYGAYMNTPPPLLSPFRWSHKVLERLEGPNDGLVSVASSKWGTHKGSLVGVNHLDLINWTNRLRWTVLRWMGRERPFNAIAFYLDIADMLAKEGL
ncbi:alpha/beta-hydrolase [Coniochaeta ligniaria NRRL 30616]|uniref:Alpha/beta-hydrolase n=1 Tax=Coniochaeta ligniaria NRRL 30616 TaxID=1408157 RepID=A0A1J7J762_9PEZI|nr:alpha/beta-hydrolase [Coniochaeta ligniaria NRRL 30616]